MLSKILVFVFIFSVGNATAWAVVGGQESTDEGVYLIKVSSKDGTFIHCSGVAVSKHVILTAAHCVAVGLVGYGAKVEVFRKSKLPMKVERTYVHPDFVQNDIPAGADLAFLILKEELSNPLIVYRTKVEKGKEFTIIGYGLSEFDDREGRSGGKQRKAKLVVKDRGSTSVRVGDAKRAACYGDSGAPLLYKGQVVGIMSHGKRGCRDGMNATLLVSHFTFIDAVLKKEGRALSWMGGCKMFAPNDRFAKYSLFAFFLFLIVLRLFQTFSRQSEKRK